jgi:hypothetical protein
MASRVEFAVSVTPIYTHVAGEGAAADVIATDVGKSVSGSGSVSVTWGSTTGYAAGSPIYVEGNGGTIGSTISGKILYIKNTGYTLVTGALGVITTADLLISIGSETNVLKVPAGAAIILPLNASMLFTLSSSSGSIAVEYFWTV